MNEEYKSINLGDCINNYNINRLVEELKNN